MHITYVEPEWAVREPSDPLPWFRVGLILPDGTQPSHVVVTCFESFDGKVAWECFSESSTGNTCDVVFEEVDATSARIAVPKRGTAGLLEWLPVVVLTAQTIPVLPCLIHAVVAPAVVLGVPVCIDWDDIRYALGDGEQGFVAMVSGPPEQAMATAYELIASAMDQSGAKWSVNSVVSALFVPGGPSMNLVRTAARYAHSLAPSSSPNILLPSLATADGASMFVLLVVADVDGA